MQIQIRNRADKGEGRADSGDRSDDAADTAPEERVRYAEERERNAEKYPADNRDEQRPPHHGPDGLIHFFQNIVRQLLAERTYPRECREEAAPVAQEEEEREEHQERIKEDVKGLVDERPEIV